MIWYSHFFQDLPQFIEIHTVKGFGTVNKAEIDVFFWNSLAFSVVTSKMLINFLSENKTVSYLGCAAQKLLFVASGPTECSLLAAMAYDCSAASTILSCVQSAWLPASTCHSALLPMWVASCMLLYTQWPLSASPSVPPVKSDMCSVTSLPSSLFLALTLTRTSFCSSPLWALLRWSLS